MSYKRHRFPCARIAHAVWLYFRFPLGFRLVESIWLGRQIISYETICRPSLKFGAINARALRRKPATPGDYFARRAGISALSASFPLSV